MFSINKKIAIVITDGVGYRNFVMSDFVLEIQQRFQDISIYSGLPKSVFEQTEIRQNIKIFELDVFNENKLTWFFRKWKELAHLKKHQHFAGMNENYLGGYPKDNKLGSFLLKIIYFIVRCWHSNKSILFAEKMQFWSLSQNDVTKSYNNLLKNDKPDLVFFTHQRPSYLAPLLAVVEKQNIKTATFIFSWDNLSSKGRMLGAFDYFLVWSDLMKNELLFFYNQIIETQVKVIGTPQFEPYVLDRYYSNDGSFFNKFSLNPNKKTICYSCADISIGANDTIVIAEIQKAIDLKKIENAQLLVRTSPAESPERFYDLKKNYPNITWNFPKWQSTRENHTESWSQRIPTFDDIVDLRSILENADLSVNMCSTMSLDFMIFNKPVVCTVFGNAENGLFNDQLFLKYDHFKKVVDSGAIRIAKNANDLIHEINFLLQNPSSNEVERRNMVNLQISKPLAGTSSRIAETLANIANV